MPPKTERNAAIVTAHRFHIPTRTIADRFAITPARVSSILRRAGMNRPTGRPPLPAMGDEERRTYNKLRRALGAKVARAEMFPNATDKALASDPRYANMVWDFIMRGG